MRHTIAVLCVLFLSCTLAAQTPTVKLATLAPQGTSLHRAMLTMGEKWRKAPGGGVQLVVYPGGHLGSEAAVVSRMRVGSLQAALLTVVGLAEIDPSVKALQEMPMMFRSLEEVDYVREKMAPELTRRFQEKGFVVLCWGDAGWVHLFSKQPLVHPADLRKMKIFSWSGDTNQEAVWRSGGFRPVPVDMNDVLPGLQTGLIDAIAMIPFQALAGQFNTVAKHMLAIRWVPLAGGVVITKKAWDTFPPATQQALLKAGREASEEIKARSRSESEQAVEAMKKRGLIVQPATPELEAEWRREVEQFYPRIRGRMVPAEKFDEVQRLLREYRAQRGSRP